jgi:hypothetical protein
MGRGCRSPPQFLSVFWIEWDIRADWEHIGAVLLPRVDERALPGTYLRSFIAFFTSPNLPKKSFVLAAACGTS